MPMTRISQEAFNYLKRQSGESGEPMSIILDRWMSKDMAELKNKPPAPAPKLPEVKPAAKPVGRPRKAHKRTAVKALPKPVQQPLPKPVQDVKPWGSPGVRVEVLPDDKDNIRSVLAKGNYLITPKEAREHPEMVK